MSQYGRICVLYFEQTETGEFLMWKKYYVKSEWSMRSYMAAAGYDNLGQIVQEIALIRILYL